MAQVLRVTRITAVVAGALGVIVAIVAEDVIDALTIFYTLMAVGLFVPILAGLFSRTPSPAGALAAIVAGVAIVGGLQVFHNGARRRRPHAGDAGVAGQRLDAVRCRSWKAVEASFVRTDSPTAEPLNPSRSAEASAERRTPNAELRFSYAQNRNHSG